MSSNRHSVTSQSQGHHHESTSHTNDFWKIKIRYYFNEILDCNDDEKVNAEDIKIIQDFYKDIKKLKETDKKLVSFNNFLDKWKSNLLAGKDSISGEDFQKYCEGLRAHLLRHKEWPSNMGNYIDALFTMLDDDDDGFINLKDFLSISINDDDTKCRTQSWKLISGSSSTESFKMSKDLFDKLSREFIISTDPKALGNWIFGTFDYKNYDKNKELEKKQKAQRIKDAEKMMEKIEKEKERVEKENEGKDKKDNKEELNEIEKNALR